MYHGDYRVVEWLLTPSKQSFSGIMERLQSWWVIANTKWTIVQLYHGEIRVEWLLTPSEQSFSCIMERLQSWVINVKWAIIQLYHGEITELLSDCWHQVSNRSAVSWRDYRVEWLTPSEQSFSCIMEITELLSDCWHKVSNRSAVSWRDYRVDEWLLTPSEQSISCIMERLELSDC
jgi:hypothetical protein